jgi:xylulokinase
MPVDVKEIRLTGGLSRSDAWCQAIADIFEAETVPVEGEGAALGAALHAAWVWQQENQTPIELKNVVQPFIILDEKRRKLPDKDAVPVYQKQKALFAALSKRARGLAGKNPFKLRTELL